MSRLLRFLDGLIQRPGAYHSTWQALKELGWLRSVVLAVWAFWTLVASGVAAIHAMGWGAWPILGLILTAATIGVVAGAVWLVRYVRGEASDAPRPRAVAAAAAVVAPDRWLQDAVIYAVRGRWLGGHEEAFPENGQRAKAAALLGEIRQLARNGELTIFGKIWENSTWDPIPAEYWAHHDVDGTEMMRERQEDMRTSSATPQGKDGPFYKSLRVSKVQFERRWPAVAR